MGRPVVHWIWDFDSELSVPEVYSGELQVSDDYGGLSLRLKNARKFAGASLNNQDLFCDDLWEPVEGIGWKGLILTEERGGELTFKFSGSTSFLMARMASK